MRLNKIEKDTEKHVKEKVLYGEFLQILFCVDKKVGNIREYHPEIDWILRTINNYYCSSHEQDVLTAHHLTHTHGIIINLDSLMSEKKEVQFEGVRSAIERLVGAKRWKSKEGGEG